MMRYRNKPYGWMPRPFKLKCPMCGNDIPYIESEGDSDWGGKDTISHVYECDGCMLHISHNMERDDK